MDKKISIAIIAEVANGLTVRQAVDKVLGAGMFEKIAGEIYDSLKK